MAMRLPLASGYGLRLVRDNPWRAGRPVRRATVDESSPGHDASSGDARPVLRVAATMAAIALVRLAVVVIALLAVLRVT